MIDSVLIVLAVTITLSLTLFSIIVCWCRTPVYDGMEPEFYETENIEDVL